MIAKEYDLYVIFNQKFGWSYSEFCHFSLGKMLYWLDLISLEIKNAEHRIKSNNKR